MNLSECAKFANENPVGFVATVDGDQPRVRAFGMWYADETGFYFQMGSNKGAYKQLQTNPKLEVCFYNNPEPNSGLGKMLRVSGQAEFLNDIALKEKLLNERPFLRALGITGPEDPNLIVFKIAHGECSMWGMSPEFREVIEKVEF